MKFSAIQFAAVTAILVLGSSSLMAESSCKGKMESVCGQDQSCSWVAPHLRKDGKHVGGYCRSKPTKKLDVAQNEPAAAPAVAPVQAAVPTTIK